ncbi:MAG: hypothetical protein FWF84_06100, partial [Kiritimatiellaeota bacterium]|nr:hypothetical protein [Kiritimatiellota bacterium]
GRGGSDEGVPTLAGAVYGSETMPEAPGSAGGGTTGKVGLSAGGGLVRIDAAGTVTVNGSLVANGQDTGAQSQWGAGSGGGIYVTCTRFTGTGWLRANGGADILNNYSYNGTGGGGRIAVWGRENIGYTAWHGYAEALGGAVSGHSSNTSYPGQDGTVYWAQGAYILNDSASAIDFYSATVNGELVVNGEGDATVTVYWGETDGGTVAGAWDDHYTYGSSYPDGQTFAYPLTELDPGKRYFYRFCAVNDLMTTWAPETESFETISLAPVIANLPATAVTTASATLCGFLSSTGDTPTAVSVYWGKDDYGDAAGLWPNVAVFDGVHEVGALSTNVTLDAASCYYYRYYASNAAGGTWTETAEVVLTGEVTVQATTPMAAESGPVPGVFTIRRPVTLTDEPLTVNYAIGGSAVLGFNYTLDPEGTSIVMDEGVPEVTVTVLPIWNDIIEGDMSVTLTIMPGSYAIGAAKTDTVTILDDAVVAGTNTTLGNGDWADRNIWSLERIPIAGDDVDIKHAVLLANATRHLNSITVGGSGAVLTFADTTNLQTCLTATDVYVRNAGRMTCVTNSVVSTNAVGEWLFDSWINIDCARLVVDEGGAIDVNAKGFNGGGLENGFGPGGGVYNGGDNGGGGRYATAYGSADYPDFPGSGGGGRLNNGTVYGGYGGGYIRIDASDRVTVNGVICANGEDATAGAKQYAGPGSGGGILIECETFTGATGLVTAHGGNGIWNWGNGAEGGRIAVRYDTTAQAGLNATAKPTVRFGANQGACDPNHSSSVKISSRPGTLWFPDDGFFPWENLLGGEICIPGFTAWNPATLTITGGIALFPEGFTLDVTGDVTVTGKVGALEMAGGTLSIGGDLIIADNRLWDSTFRAGQGSHFTVGGSLRFNQGHLVVTSDDDAAAVVTVMGDVALAASSLRLASAMTGEGTPFYGALLKVSGDMTLSGNSWVYPVSHATNGGSPVFYAKNLVIEQGSGFNANGAGFGGGAGRQTDGYGTPEGRGRWTQMPNATDYQGNGGGYGGAGGGEPDFVGMPYGSEKAPAFPGSGGSGRPNSTTRGGAGGGLIRIELDRDLTLDGTLTANGEGVQWGGYGSGGGIYVTCRKLFGATGTVTANGGGSGANGGGGGGGGIAIPRSQDLTAPFSETWESVTANGGPGYDPGANGTVYWGIRAPATLIIIR